MKITTAEICVPCKDLTSTLRYFTDTLGFRIDMIFPADAPHTAVISAHGVRLRLVESLAAAALPTLRLNGDHLSHLAASLGAPTNVLPDELRIEFVDSSDAVEIPGTAVNDEFILSRFDASANGWNVGRAGMQYRDLIPSRLGGRFIASHIRIPDGGEVSDYVHFHKLRFQMILCKRGWARLVYEDQGEPFLMRAGDCVLQPPEIRHRVLEASAGLEVIEIGCPAIHETWADHETPLPTPTINRSKKFAGQSFVHHQAADAAWRATTSSAWGTQDTGIRAATSGLADVRVQRAGVNGLSASASGSASAVASVPIRSFKSAREFHFLFVLNGSAKLTSVERGTQYLSENDCCVLPAGIDFQLSPIAGGRGAQSGANADCEILEVRLPGA